VAMNNWWLKGSPPGLPVTAGPCGSNQDWWDIRADRGDQRMYVEAKGRTTSPGLDMDTVFGQLIRRMPAEDDPSVTFALAVRDESKSVRAALRVPIRIRHLLRIQMFAVADAGQVRELINP